MDILNKNIIGCTITFTITERGKGDVTKNETIKEISYPDTIWTKEHGYALHYFEDKHDIVIKKDNVELTREEIVTQPRGFMFGKFECNWADEFDVEGTCAMLLEEYEYSYERSSRNLDKIFTPLTEEHYNECVKYETEVLKNLSPYEFNKKNPNEKVQMDKIRPYGAKECKSYSEYIQKFKTD